jgi:hypothetical protein
MVGTSWYFEARKRRVRLNVAFVRWLFVDRMKDAKSAPVVGALVPGVEEYFFGDWEMR